MKDIKNFDQLVSICEETTKKHTVHSSVESRVYTDYGWGSVAIMTDHFGGTYVNLHYDFKTGKVTNWYGTKDEQVIEDIDQLINVIIKSEAALLKGRDLNAIADFINAEY
jgi:hypothetical protein